MTKEETISNLKAYLNGDTAIGNIIPLRSILESAIKYLSEPSLLSNLDEAAEEYSNCPFTDDKGDLHNASDLNLYDAFKAGAEWMAGQGYSKEARVWVLGKDETPAVGVDDVIYLPKDLFHRGDKVIVQVRN